MCVCDFNCVTPCKCSSHLLLLLLLAGPGTCPSSRSPPPRSSPSSRCVPRSSRPPPLLEPAPRLDNEAFRFRLRSAPSSGAGDERCDLPLKRVSACALSLPPLSALSLSLGDALPREDSRRWCRSLPCNPPPPPPLLPPSQRSSQEALSLCRRRCSCCCRRWPCSVG